MSPPIRVKTFMWPLIGLLSRLRMAWLVSRAWLRLCTKLDLPSAVSCETERARYRVLILNIDKAGVHEDIAETFTTTNDYEVIVWPSYALRAVAREMLAPGLSHDRYVTSDPTVEASKLRYRKFLRQAWEWFTASLPIDAVIGVNFGYYTQREFATALEESGTPFIVLQKENLNGMTPRRANFWRTVYEKGRGKFTGRKILVYNDTERELQISSGIVEPKNIVVTGMPRLDRIHKWRREHAGGTIPHSQVLFFGFSREDKLPGRGGKIKRLKAEGLLTTTEDLEEIGEPWSELSWDRLCTGTCQGIAAFARSHPDVRVMVKTKALTTQTEETVALLKGGGELPANIEVIHGGDPFELITQSSVVVGFNTTGLIEAVAAGKPVVVPRFGEVNNQTMRDIVIDLGDSVDYARSPEELIERISARLEGGGTVPFDLPTSSAKMLRRLVGNDDGAACFRFLQALRSEIGARGSATFR